MQARAVTVIPQRVRPFSQGAPLTKRRRVAAYARVSTDNEEQLTSYEAQVDYYTNYIKNRSDWEFAGLCTDEGISATNTKHRDGFNQMVADALAGKIDLIITKSVSRFARNTVDSLVTVRKLKERGVEVYFEKENIYTLDSKGELLITIMSSLAQEESRSISENTTWGQRKRFADGKVSMPYGQFLGYDRGVNGQPVINEAEAEVVRTIYRMFLDGNTPHGIAKRLTQAGIPTPGGKEKWLSGTVTSILSNEKYKGDALLQKSFTVDFLTKKTKRNEGEVPQYYVENSHDAIVDADIFEMVQHELARRKSSPTRHSGTGIFSGKIVCGDCGSFYGAKVWHSSDKYRRVVYRCNHKFDNDRKCQTPHLNEEQIKHLFISALNILFSKRDELTANFKEIRHVLFSTAELDTEIDLSQGEMTVVCGLIEQLVHENAHSIVNQDEYNRKYNELTARHAALSSRHDELVCRRSDLLMRKKAAERFFSELARQPQSVTEFDEHMWHTLLDFVTVYSKDDVRFTFRDGSVVTVGGITNSEQMPQLLL